MQTKIFVLRDHGQVHNESQEIGKKFERACRTSLLVRFGKDEGYDRAVCLLQHTLFSCCLDFRRNFFSLFLQDAQALIYRLVINHSFDASEISMILLLAFLHCLLNAS